ncbi:MAG: inositol monophosphatase family protein, partial [Thermoanaerobaculia bacterium]
FKNDKRISVSKRKNTKNCIFATGFPFREKQLKENFSGIFLDIFDKIVDLRRMGSACQDLCFVAEGIFDGFFEYGLSPWDIAAGILIVEEAGGKVSDFKGGRDFFKNGDILATNGKIHNKMVSILKKYSRG